MKRQPTDKIVIHPRAARAFGLAYGAAFPAGAWLVTEAGELRVEAEGAVLARPTPWPWSRPSVAAIPTVYRRKELTP